jgi:hypothetical protein
MTRRQIRRLAALADRLDGADDALWSALVRVPPLRCSGSQLSHGLSARSGRPPGHSRSDLRADQPTSAVDDVVQGETT